MARRVSLRQPDEVIRCLAEDGGVIITDFAKVDEVQQVNADATPYIEAIAQERTAKSEDRGTIRCYRLFGRSTTAREVWMQQAELLKIMRHFLVTTSDEPKLATDPILSVAATMDIWPGEKAQALHRDDFIWQHTHNAQDTYKVGSDVSLGLLVPGVETTMANGATAFVPGSHLWPHERWPKSDKISYAEMALGEAFMFLGSTFHGGGANQTSQSRPMHGFFWCRSFMRPEENQFLWWSKEEVEKWSLSAQKQAGYVLDNPFLGHCNETNPLNQFRVKLATAES